MAKILIIDDEKSIRESLEHILKSEGHQIYTSHTAVNMIKFLKNNPVDIILCDIIMPEMKGTEFLESVNKTFPDIKSILFTGQPSISTVIEGIKYKASDYLHKPINKNTLLLTLSKIIQKKSVEDLNKKLKYENVQYHNKLKSIAKKQTDNLSKTFHKIISIHDKEQSDIVSNFHNEIKDDLINLKRALKAIQKKSKSLNKSSMLIKDIDQIISNEKKINNINNFTEIKKIGLQQSIINLCEYFIEKHKIKINLSINPLVEFKNTVSKNIYWTIKEILGNTIEHSKATEISIKINNKNDIYSINIKDNGIGFDSSIINNYNIKENKLGLRLIHERVNICNGKFKIHSNNKGTKIKIKIPI